MKFEKVSVKKSWKAPVLTSLAPDDRQVRDAAAQDKQFGDAVTAASTKG